MRRLRFRDFQIVLVNTRRHDGLFDHWSAYWRNMAFNRRRTRLHAPPGFLAAPPRAGGLSTRLTRAELSCWCHLMSSDDVISPRQQPHKLVHVSPSPRQRHVIGWHQRLHCSTRDLTRNRLGPVSVDFDPRLVDFDFDFLRWPLTKSQNFWHGLSCSVFRVDSNFELRFFIWSPKIGQLAHSSLWFLQRHSSWHL